MAGEPTLRPGDESVDGWVEYLQAQLVNLGAAIEEIPFEAEPTGVFDDETERWVRVFQRYHGLMIDGIVGDETWNMLHGNVDTEDPGTDGRAPGTYVEESPRLEWENDTHFDVVDATYTYTVMNVGSAAISDVAVSVRRTDGPVDVADGTVHGWTEDGQPVPPGGTMHFVVRLERELQADEDVMIELTLPTENGGAVFEPGCSGLLQAMARGETVD